jgi:hypothetical protein
MNLVLDSKHVCFWYSLIVWYWVMKCLCLVYACLLIVVIYFTSDRIEWHQVQRGRRSVWVPGRRRPGTSQSRQAIYTWYISDPIHLLCMLHKGLLNYMFLYCYSPCSKLFVGSSSTSQFVIILRDDPFWTPI